MNTRVKIDSHLPPASFSRLWLVYFLLTIGVVGALSAYVLCVPLYLLARVWPRLSGVADFILQKAIYFLMHIQPWLNAKIDLPPMLLTRSFEQEPVLLVSNHRSHLDVFILLSRIPGIKVLAKDSLMRIPFLGLMMRMSRQIPISRGQLDGFFRAFDEIRQRLRQGDLVHVFPEMTRCHMGHSGTLQFNSAPFQVAIQEKAKVIPVVFKNTDCAWPRGVFGLSFRQAITVTALPPIDAQIFSSSEALKQEVFAQINRSLQ